MPENLGYCKEGMTQEGLTKMDISNHIQMINEELEIIHKQLKLMKLVYGAEINETIPKCVTIK